MHLYIIQSTWRWPLSIFNHFWSFSSSFFKCTAHAFWTYCIRLTPPIPPVRRPFIHEWMPRFPTQGRRTHCSIVNMPVFDVQSIHDGMKFIPIVWIVLVPAMAWNVVGKYQKTEPRLSSHASMWSSHSYGIAAGLEEPPENCVFATGTCEPRLVSANDSTKPCPSDDTRVTSARRRVRVKLFSLRRKNATINWWFSLFSFRNKRNGLTLVWIRRE